MSTSRSLTLAPLLASLIAAGSLVACNRAQEPRTAGQAVDQTIAKTENAAKDVAADTRAAADRAATATADASAKASNSVRDAAITMEVKAMLAKDPNLSALAINVDTAGGRVALKGTAPTGAAKDRASELARAVSGVTAVNNELAVKAGS
ncbi:MAG: BON domain-containing protein [Burkholderiaceae bacterium]